MSDRRPAFVLRVQAQRVNGEWLTIEDAGEALVILEGDLVDLLARWAAWFEARGFDQNAGSILPGLRFCAACLQDTEDQGHAPDCVYGVTKKLLSEAGEEE